MKMPKIPIIIDTYIACLCLLFGFNNYNIYQNNDDQPASNFILRSLHHLSDVTKNEVFKNIAKNRVLYY